MDGRRCFIRMGGRTTMVFYKDGWMGGRTDDVVLWVDGRGWWMDGRRCFYKDGWMDERRCFIRMGGWTDDVVL